MTLLPGTALCARHGRLRRCGDPLERGERRRAAPVGAPAAALSDTVDLWSAGLRATVGPCGGILVLHRRRQGLMVYGPSLFVSFSST